MANIAVDKEKVEKRRALGRGLESLLPGPRVVSSGGGAVAPGQSGGDAGKQQVPPLRVAQGRNDNAFVEGRSDAVVGVAIPGVIQAVVDDADVVENEAAGAAELRSARPGLRPVPTQTGTPAASDEAETITIFAQAESRMPGNLVANLEIADIDKNPFQTRYVSDNDALEELSDSIKANGVVQPILVRPGDEEGRYILVLGERRLLASKKAGKTTIPAMVRKVSLQQAAEMTIVENLQREDLSALEQAEAFRVLSSEFKMTQQQIGERVGLSRASVTNYMRLLKLPRDVMQLLAEKKISFAEAKELLTLENDDQISKGALYAVKKGLTLEQIERMVLSMNGDLDPFPGMPGQVVKKSGARWVDPNVRSAQNDLERMLGVRVRIRDRKGKGKIVIEYHTVDDYERVVEMLRGKSSS
jgi:ParB family transcriptional regulator, chromosome partitioning protein